MTEVLGYILTFGLLSIVLVLAMIAFGAARSNAADQAARLQADSTAQQIASLGVEGALFAERHGTTAAYQRQVELPRNFEGRSYTVGFQFDDGTRPDRVVLEVGSLGYIATAPLFSAGAAASVDVCENIIQGGPALILFGANSAPHPTGAGGPAATCLSIQEVP